MHYKTRTYLNEAVTVKSTGCDMNEVWSMYAIFSFWSCDSQGRDLLCIHPSVPPDPNPAIEPGFQISVTRTDIWGLASA